MKRTYMIPETKVSEFKTQLMCLSIDDDDIADGGGVLAPERDGRGDADWGNLWN